MDIGNMLPWEREIYSHLLIDQLRKEKEEIEKASGKNG